mgnify:CR=1 FL=1|jgi:CRISPR type III-B/RAMP module-associated protein Cmr5
MSETFQTREQKYATAVYSRVQNYIKVCVDKSPADKQASIKANPAEDKNIKAYGSLAHKLPILIRTSGLAQALAFVKARNENNSPQYQLIKDLEAVMQQVGPLQGELFEQSRTTLFDDYIRLTEACMEALLWFKRFATSELGVEQGDETEGA